MGRRALKQPDPRLDLSGHLLTWDDLPLPWDSESLFQRAAPLELEVGSGKGLFLASASAGRPKHDFLGIEVSRKYARFAAARLAKNDVANARVLHADATRLLSEKLPDESAQQIHIYFPDPWWKKKHVKRRIMTAGFLRQVQRVLAEGGKLHFWTDVETYFNDALSVIAAATHLEGPIDVSPCEPAHDLDYRTHFERRKRLVGEPIYRAEFRK